MITVKKAFFVATASLLLIASAASSAGAENRHGVMPSRQMYTHKSMHGMHRPIMHHRAMTHHRMMHRRAM